MVAAAAVSAAIAFAGISASAAPTSSPPVTPDLDIRFLWYPDSVVVDVVDLRVDDDVPVTCNGVESEPFATGGGSSVRLTDDVRTLDIACELETGESFEFSLPALERVDRGGWTFYRSDEAEAAISQCESRTREDSVLFAQVWPWTTNTLWCPTSIGEFRVDPPELFVSKELTLIVCLPDSDGNCVGRANADVAATSEPAS